MRILIVALALLAIAGPAMACDGGGGGGLDLMPRDAETIRMDGGGGGW